MLQKVQREYREWKGTKMKPSVEYVTANIIYGKRKRESIIERTTVNKTHDGEKKLKSERKGEERMAQNKISDSGK